MRWESVEAASKALDRPPIALPRLELPEVVARVVPARVGDRGVDRALDAYRKVADRARATRAESTGIATEHFGLVGRFGQAWMDWVRFGRHRGGEEPNPDDVIADTERVIEWHARAVDEIELVEPAWQKVLVAVARADGLRAARLEIAVAARSSYLEVLAAVPARFAELAEAEALHRWCDDPDVVGYAVSSNPIAFRFETRDAHGANLRRVVSALALLAGDEPATAPIDDTAALEAAIA
jgi:hypothetical protein